MSLKSLFSGHSTPMHLCHQKTNQLEVFAIFLPWSFPTFIPGLIFLVIILPGFVGVIIQSIRLFMSYIGVITLQEPIEIAPIVGVLCLCLLFLFPLFVAIRETKINRYLFDRVTGDIRLFHRSLDQPLKEYHQKAFPLSIVKALTVKRSKYQEYVGQGAMGTSGILKTTYSTYLKCLDGEGKPVGDLRLAHIDDSLIHRIATFIEVPIFPYDQNTK